MARSGRRRPALSVTATEAGRRPVDFEIERHRDFYVHEPVVICFAFDHDDLDATEQAEIAGLAGYLGRNPHWSVIRTDGLRPGELVDVLDRCSGAPTCIAARGVPPGAKCTSTTTTFIGEPGYDCVGDRGYPAGTMNRLAVIAVVAVLTACKKDKPAAPPTAVDKPAADAAAAPPPEPTPPPPAVDAAPAAAAPPSTEAQRLEVEHLSSKIPVDAQVPVGWIRRDPITTWDPPDARQLPMWHRSYEITATCDGGCTPAELDKKMATYLDAVVARRKQPNMSGNPEQDAKAIAPVTELERGELPQGGRFVLLRVGKPPGFENDPYPDVFAGTCITRRPKDEFMIITSIMAAPDDEKTWWPVLVAACKATKVAATP